MLCILPVRTEMSRLGDLIDRIDENKIDKQYSDQVRYGRVYVLAYLS